MIVNVIGDCDKRPVIYTLMKIFQTLGDVLFVTNNSYFRKLSETGESGGHYQNVMIAFTNEGLGDFFEEFRYDYGDFSHVILDNLQAAEADLNIHCYSLLDSEYVKDMLEYLDDVHGINLWTDKGIGAAPLACEKFEAFRVMTPMPISIVMQVANIVAPGLKASVDNVIKIAMAVPPGSESIKAQPRPVGNTPTRKSPFDLLKKGGR